MHTCPPFSYTQTPSTAIFVDSTYMKDGRGAIIAIFPHSEPTIAKCNPCKGGKSVEHLAIATWASVASQQLLILY